ncbi:MAG: trans-2-enoyl-CoA reductase family protein [Negativicutes bacterium]|nr:trans-2-enoyl-CoA reductase family protein [Negativicutes bacterium]
MKVKPEFRGMIALNVHPFGCRQAVREQIASVGRRGKFAGCKKALIIGGSSGYGLATRVVSAFGCGADTIGVSFETGVSGKRLGSAGWWNNIWFKEEAEKCGLVARNFVGDAFSREMKDEVIDYIKREFGGQVDWVVYSLASGRRTDPADGRTYTSALKSIGCEVEGATIDINKKKIVTGRMAQASDEEIAATIKVMGGEDWLLWIEALAAAGVLARGCKTTAYSYDGPKATRAIYGGGTIGAAKRDLEAKGREIDRIMKRLGGEGFVTVCRAIVTKASVYIPLLPIYVSVLFKVMKERGVHETAVEHIYRFMRDMVYGNRRVTDDEGRVRPDNWEMDPAIQAEVERIMPQVNDDNLETITDFAGFMDDFLKINGFGYEGIDYDGELDSDELARYRY